VKNIHHKSRSIGFTIFIMTLGIVSLALILTSVVFLGIFSKLLDDIIESQAREINKQIVMNYESYINSVIETATYIQTATIKYDTLTDTKSLDELYLANTEIKKDVVSIVLFNTDGKRVAGSYINPQNKESIKGLSWFTSALLIKEIYHFSTEQGKSIAENKEENVISISKSVSYTAGKNTLNGVLLIELNNETLTDLAKKTNLGEAGHLLILNDKGDLIYSSESGNALMTELSTPIARTMFLGSSKATINNINMYISVNTLIQTRWRIVTVSNINEIRNALTRVSGILLLIFLVAVAVSALVAGLISLRVSHPINQLKTAMLNIEQGDFSQPISVSGQIEIVTLTHSFNNMILKIQELMARLVSQQREKRKMELHILQNQINPHFLYNTLDSIVWLAEHERNKDVITTVVSLAHFFRISISKGESFIPIEDEIFHVENYLTIQNIRYVNKFTYTISIDERLNKIKVMKLILQPLVENAIYHGIGDEEGHINIRGIMEKDFIVFHVINTGYGLTNEKIEQMYETMRGGTERPSIGIRNVYQRLKLYYGEKADMTISSIPDESTTISLYIPYKEEIVR